MAHYVLRSLYRQEAPTVIRSGCNAWGLLLDGLGYGVQCQGKADGEPSALHVNPFHKRGGFLRVNGVYRC